MIVNCLKCGVAVSTKMTACPYCMVEMGEISLSTQKGFFGRKQKKLKQKYSGTIFSLGLKM